MQQQQRLELPQCPGVKKNHDHPLLLPRPTTTGLFPADSLTQLLFQRRR
jgi:hypothetical protein